MLYPADGPDKWRNELTARFRENAERCRGEAQKASDTQAQDYNANLAKLWGQLEIAASYKPL